MCVIIAEMFVHGSKEAADIFIETGSNTGIFAFIIAGMCSLTHHWSPQVVGIDNDLSWHINPVIRHLNIFAHHNFCRSDMPGLMCR